MSIEKLLAQPESNAQVTKSMPIITFTIGILLTYWKNYILIREFCLAGTPLTFFVRECMTKNEIDNSNINISKNV